MDASPSPSVGAKRTVSGHAVQAPVSGVAALPSFIARSILQSAVSSSEQDTLTIDNARLSKPYQDLAAVSKHWRALALDAVSSLALRTLSAHVEKLRRRDVLELRRQITLQRAFLESLDIQRIPPIGKIRREQWVAVLSCAPRLQEVKLDKLKNASNAQLGAIVRAVGMQCKSLESLVVSAAYSNNQNSFVPAESMRRQLSDPVYYTMKQVHKNTNGVGLRQLCVCMRFDLQGLESTRKYIDHVLRFCPNLERFDGYLAAVYPGALQLCYEQWYMDLELWTRFCSTLHCLSEFNWICVPFATRFFEIFGQHAKPKMKAMMFTAASNWKWNHFLENVELQDQLIETGCAGTAKNAHAAMRACPHLENLTISWYREPEPVAVPGMTTMNPEIFGDEFWEAAVGLCPKLTSVWVVPIQNGAEANLTTFTDRSLRAIAKLPWLTYVAADYINVTGDGIFDLAVHHAAAITKHRQFHISVGDLEKAEMDTRFYDAVTRFLQKLLATEAPLPCRRSRVSMCIKNLRAIPVELEWSKTYLADLMLLIQQVKDKHTDAELNVFASACDGTSFMQINEFVFDTQVELTNWWMEPGDVRVADSLWDRTGEGESSEGEYDMDDDDDDSRFDSDPDDMYGGEDDHAFWRSGSDSDDE